MQQQSIFAAYFRMDDLDKYKKLVARNMNNWLANRDQLGTTSALAMTRLSKRVSCAAAAAGVVVGLTTNQSSSSSILYCYHLVVCFGALLMVAPLKASLIWSARS
jgi:hypothetical protein